MKKLYLCILTLISFLFCSSPEQRAKENTYGTFKLCPNFGKLYNESLNKESEFNSADGRILVMLKNKNGESKNHEKMYLTSALKINTENEYSKFISIYDDICDSIPPFITEIEYYKNTLRPLTANQILSENKSFKPQIILVNGTDNLDFIVASRFDRFENSVFYNHDEFFANDFQREENKERISKFKKNPLYILFYENISVNQFESYNFNSSSQTIQSNFTEVRINTKNASKFMWEFLESGVFGKIKLEVKIPKEISKEIINYKDRSQEIGTLFTIIEIENTYTKDGTERECVSVRNSECMRFETKKVKYKYIKIKPVKANFLYKSKLY